MNPNFLTFLKPSSLTCSTLLGLASVLMMNPAAAQEAQKPIEEKAEKAESDKADELKVVQISKDVYRLGKVTFNKKTREISLPARAEIVGQEILEYLLVTSQGKIHESLFITEAKPSHVNIAFKLLGYKEAKHLFRTINEDFQPQEDYETATDEEKEKSKFKISVKWLSDGVKKSHPVEDLVKNVKTKKNLEVTPWVYGGSYIHKGSYVADLNHDIIAIYTDRAAVANYAGEGREDDTLWVPQSDILPAQGTPVVLKFSPHTGKNEDPAVQSKQK